LRGSDRDLRSFKNFVNLYPQIKYVYLSLHKPIKLKTLSLFFILTLLASCTNESKWTPSYKKRIKDSLPFLKFEGSKLTQKNRTKLCDCILKKLETIYPNKPTEAIPRDSLNRVYWDCLPTVVPGLGRL
jgi:hypothetical protein